MATTYENDERKVNIVAEDLSLTLQGLEILATAVDGVVQFDDTMREIIEETIVNSGPWPIGPHGTLELSASKPIAAALIALAEADDDDLLNPVQSWLQASPAIAALYRRLLNENHSDDVVMFGSEVLISTNMKGVSASLVTGDSDDYAQLIVSKGLAVMICLIRCPKIIKVAFDVAVDS